MMLDRAFYATEDPGGSIFLGMRVVIRRTLLSMIADWQDGPPGYAWAGLETALYLSITYRAAHADAAALAFLREFGNQYLAFIGATFGAWIGLRVVRAWRRRGISDEA